MLLVALFAAALAAAPPAADGAALRARLAAGEPLRISFLGDSITWGMDLPRADRDGYPAVFADLLRVGWPGLVVDARVLGVPGAPTREGLGRFADDVAPDRPHLVVLQYGGNDKGVGDGLGSLLTYRANLKALIGRARDIGAAPLVMAPPMHELILGMPYPVAAQSVGDELRVPVAQVDAVLKRPPLDYRGTFPYGIHPREHEHAKMALELYRAFGELIGVAPPVTCDLPDHLAEARLGGRVVVPVTVRNPGAAQQAVTLVLEGGPPSLAPPPTRTVLLQAGEQQTVELAVALPRTLPGGRAAEYPLRLVARGDGPPAFDLARLTLVPRVAVPAPGDGAAPTAELASPHLHLVTGWSNTDDLSAVFWLTADAESLRLVCDVTDDQHQTGTGVPFGDGVELYLDLRDEADRGRPFYTPLCAVLFLTATAPGEPATVTTLDADTPPAGLLRLVPRWTLRDGGYRLELTIPREVLDTAAGRRVNRFGFDLAVDDHDGTRRDAQLIWCGRTDNYVNPRRLAELVLDAPAPADVVRATIF